jgi:hypothetical protein
MGTMIIFAIGTFNLGYLGTIVVTSNLMSSDLSNITTPAP